MQPLDSTPPPSFDTLPAPPGEPFIDEDGVRRFMLPPSDSYADRMASVPMPYSTDADEPVAVRLAPLAARPWGPTPATELLEAWIARSPAHRCVDRLARIGKCWCIELHSESGVFTSVTQETIDRAIRTVLMIAVCEGEP